jgi:hypothetical protein
MDIYEKFGDFLLNMINLVVGGIIFAAVMADDSLDKWVLYTVAISLVITMFAIAFLLFRVSKKKSKK